MTQPLQKSSQGRSAFRRQTGEAGATNLPTRLRTLAGELMVALILLACLAVPAIFGGL